MAGPVRQLMSLRPGDAKDDEKAEAIFHEFFNYLNGTGKYESDYGDGERFAEAMSEYTTLEKTANGKRTLRDILTSRAGRPPVYPTRKRGARRRRAGRKTYSKRRV